jgi:DNA polymerase II large subunit
MVQTSIDWFWKQLPEILPSSVDTETGIKLLRAYEQANEMHKEETMDAFQAGKWDWAEHSNNNKHSKDPAEYYNETFKKD